MTFTTFIKRPVLSTVISIVIVLLGFIGLATLPIEQYPDIAPPTVVVFTSYPGADAETVKNSVLVPLERTVAVPSSMEDQCTFWLARTFEFHQYWPSCERERRDCLCETHSTSLTGNGRRLSECLSLSL